MTFKEWSPESEIIINCLQYIMTIFISIILFLSYLPLNVTSSYANSVYLFFNHLLH